MAENELKAACERVRRITNGEYVCQVYTERTPGPYDEAELRIAADLHRADRFDLARAYLAEHPADGDTPIDGEYKAAVGFVDNVLKLHSGWQLEVYSSSTMLVHDDSHHFYGSREEISLKHVTTRNQLRALCSALGVAIKG